MFEAVEGMRQEHAEIEQRLALPETHADQRLAKELNQRYAELTAVVATWQDWLQARRRHRGGPRARLRRPGLRAGGRRARRTP